MSTKLRTILFDLGNVLVHFSHERMCRQVGELCGLSENETRAVLMDGPLHRDYERGRITCSELSAALSRETGRVLELEALRVAAGNIFEQNERMYEVAAELKNQGLRLVLLSNTCPAHIDWIRANLRVLDLFDHQVLSYEVGAAKPESAIFEEALRHLECGPEECLYVDDIGEYVETGRRYGLQGFCFRETGEFVEELSRHGITIPRGEADSASGTLESE